MPSSDIFKDRYDAYSSHLTKWFKDPDIEGSYITLCTYQSHFWLKDPPIFLQILGLPGSGKTIIGCGAITSIDSEVDQESELTENSFLSGFGDDIGILARFPKAKKDGNVIRSNGIIIFPDFSTTIMSQQHDTAKRILGQMRRIYDGEHEKRVGNRGLKLEWKGKVTIIAACTPNIEEYWTIHRDMGERWINIRWITKTESFDDLLDYAEVSSKQIGHKEEIRKGIKSYVKSLMDGLGSGNDISLDPEIFRITQAQAILLEMMRVNIKREYVGGRGYQVTGSGDIQVPTRTPQNLVSIARASTLIRRSNEVSDFELKLLRRICLDSIPLRRAKILEILIDRFPQPILKRELATLIALSRTTFDRTLEDLRYLSAISICPSTEENLVEELDEESIAYDTNTPYSIKTPKALDMVALTSKLINVLRAAKMII